MHVGMLCEQRPVKPTDLVVLAVGVVVTVLSTPHFVAHQNHRQTQRKHRHCQQVLYLAISQRLHRGILCRTLDTPVIASVVVSSVTVVLTVRLVVLLTVRDEIVQRKAVVTSNEIDACFGRASLMTVNLRATEQAIRKPSNRALIATDKAA